MELSEDQGFHRLQEKRVHHHFIHLEVEVLDNHTVYLADLAEIHKQDFKLLAEVVVVAVAQGCIVVAMVVMVVVLLFYNQNKLF